MHAVEDAAAVVAAVRAIHADHAPAGGGQRIEAFDVARILAIVQPVLLPVVLEQHLRRRVHEVAVRQEGAPRIADDLVDGELGKAHVRRVVPGGIPSR